jgi:opacity protein-like surface antigen
VTEGVGQYPARRRTGQCDLRFGHTCFGLGQPHIGVGIGLGHLVVHQDAPGFLRKLNSSGTQFAYQALGGRRVPLAASWAFDIDYRYFATTDPTYKGTAGHRGNIEQLQRPQCGRQRHPRL